MGESTAEMEDGLGDSGGSDRLAVFSEADKKRRKLEEDMRREAEERTKKRQELLKQETDIEQVCVCVWVWVWVCVVLVVACYFPTTLLNTVRCYTNH